MALVLACALGAAAQDKLAVAVDAIFAGFDSNGLDWGLEGDGVKVARYFDVELLGGQPNIVGKGKIARLTCSGMEPGAKVKEFTADLRKAQLLSIGTGTSDHFYRFPECREAIDAFLARGGTILYHYNSAPFNIPSLNGLGNAPKVLEPGISLQAEVSAESKSPLLHEPNDMDKEKAFRFGGASAWPKWSDKQQTLIHKKGEPGAGLLLLFEDVGGKGKIIINRIHGVNSVNGYPSAGQALIGNIKHYVWGDLEKTAAPSLPVDAPAPAAVSAKELLKPDDVVAIVGDSITEMRGYSVIIETYLLACRPDLRLRAVQLGWSGEQAGMLAARMEEDVHPWHPNVVTICYGMNDGGYLPYSPICGQRYAYFMKWIAEKLGKTGATVVVGTPTAADTFSFKGAPGSGGAKLSPGIYNHTLDEFGKMDRRLAAELSLPCADIHSLMLEVMDKAKTAYGATYPVAGAADGIHPGPNGHLLIAYAFLKAMGLDGDIGTVTVDFKGETTASSGHKVLSAEAGQVEIESSRYPFCLPASDDSPDNAAGILPFLPFNQDLNRYLLVVKNLPAGKAEVKWGGSGKTFTREQLEAGVNLAAEFPDNPFRGKFEELTACVRAKQEYEAQMTGAAGALRKPQSQELEKSLRQEYRKSVIERQKAVAGMVIPLRHKILIVPTN